MKEGASPEKSSSQLGIRHMPDGSRTRFLGRHVLLILVSHLSRRSLEMTNFGMVLATSAGRFLHIHMTRREVGI